MILNPPKTIKSSWYYGIYFYSSNYMNCRIISEVVRAPQNSQVPRNCGKTTQKCLQHKNYLTLQSLCQSSIKEVFSKPCHFYMSSPIFSKMASKDSVLKIVFIDGVTSQNWMKNKQFIAVMILQVFHFVTERCLSKIQNLQRILKNQKMKNVRFL